jgi:hypothetical protein
MYTGRTPTDYKATSYLATVNSNIHAELDAYLNDKGINAFMTALVEKLLLIEAATPPSAIIEYLCDEYPDQALIALELLNPPKNT